MWEHRIHPVVGARFIWHNVLPTTQLRPLPPKPAPKRHFERSEKSRLVGAPDSSGRRCQIHLAQCPFDHSAPPTTQTRAHASF
ncbi:MAG: hypothetical protein WCY21_04245 [Candidatus Cloacimonadaceae bacterium]